MDRRAWSASLAAAALLVLAALAPGGRAGAVVGDVASTSPPLPTELRVVDVSDAAVPRTGGVGLVRATVIDLVSGSDATGVQVTYRLPDGVSAATVDGATPGCTATATAVTCPLGTVVAGGSVPVAIGIRVEPGAIGQLVGAFLPPRSDQWDPGAGEIAFRWWDHEADAQNVSLQTCWAVTSSSPNMDLGAVEDESFPQAPGRCDGVLDREALAPDGASVLDAFPAAFSQRVTRSWEWRTRIHTTTAGPYRICMGTVDDGGYVALAPAGTVMGPANVVVDVPSFRAEVGQVVVNLPADSDQDLLIRASNRGEPGIDNGGRNLGGWSYVGVVPAGGACSASSAAALSTTGAAVTAAEPAEIAMVGAASVRTTGTVTGPGRRWSQARVVNDGPDATVVTATALGQLTPIEPRDVGAGGATVFAAFLDPEVAIGASSQPWTITTSGTLPPQTP